MSGAGRPLSSTSEPHLVVPVAEGVKRVALLGKACWTLGRSPQNDVVLESGSVSRNHAMVQRMEWGPYFLVDLGSRNGAFVNGKRIDVPTTLHDGDQVKLGEVELQFRCPSESSSGVSDFDDPSVSRTMALRMRELISVLVVDIRGFTVLTQQIPEEKLSELIGTWFGRGAAVIESHGGFVDKYIGDAMMAVWIHENEGLVGRDVCSILRAVNALHHAAMALQNEFALPGPFLFGAGVNTGTAIIANTGSAGRPDCTALGDTVNLAFRNEAATRELKTDVVLGQMTFQNLQDWVGDATAFQATHAKLKGYEQPVPLFVSPFADLEQMLTDHFHGDPEHTLGPAPEPA